MGKQRRKKTEKHPSRPANLLDSVKGYFTPDLVHRASSMVGEPEAAARRTLNQSTASLFRGLSLMVSSREGAGVFEDLLHETRYQALTGNVSSLFSCGSAAANAASSGRELLQTIFGSSTPSVVQQVANSAGVAASSADKILVLVAPLVLGVLGKRAAAKEFNPAEMASMLRGDSSNSAASLGPVPVPKSGRSVSIPPQEPPEPTSLESPWAESMPESTSTPAVSPPHKLRRIIFLLGALIALALLVLLLIRGPVRRDSLPRGPDPATQSSRATHSTAKQITATPRHRT